MMRLVTWICVLSIGTSCILAISSKPPVELDHKTDMLTVFLTGNELGALKPCGCSGGQLGGLDRRSAVFDSIPASKRLIVDTGQLVEGDSEQDSIKFDTVVRAFHLLGYDVVNLTEKDIDVANLALFDSPESTFNIISAHRSTDVNVPAKFTKLLSLNKRTVAVTVATFDVESAPIEQVEKFFAPPLSWQTVNILILNRCDSGIIASVAEMGVVDCLVCPAESDEPTVIGDLNKRPLVVSVGRLGKYVGKLQIRTAGAGDKLKLSFSPLPVKEDLPQESSLVELYEAYQQLVKLSNLLERQPRSELPNGLKYAGSESCRLCHEYEYEKWSSKAHAHAYATLERVGSEYDPECVGCHVIGMQYVSGFVTKEKTPNLTDVGCENCHGPGSEHIKTIGETKTVEPRLDCTDCHTPDMSSEYADNEQKYFQEIIHWREPNTPSGVK